MKRGILRKIYILTTYTFNFITIIEYVISIILATYFVFLLNQYAVSISFWKDKSSKLLAVPEYLLDFSSRPISVYPSGIQILLVWVLPILLAINLPVLIIKGETNTMLILWLFIINIVGTFLALIIWNKGTERYNSAN